METRNRKLDQWWQFCICHDLSMSHGRSRTGQIPLRLLLTKVSMGKLKIQIWAQDDNSHPPVWCLKETQPSESKALRNLKRQHPNSFNVFWIIELTLNPETIENSSDTESLEAAHCPSQKTWRAPLASSTIHVQCLFGCAL